MLRIDSKASVQPSQPSQPTTETCSRCVVFTKQGERCKNSSCKEENSPLCGLHLTKLKKIIDDFDNLSDEGKAKVLPQISWYLGSRNIQFKLVTMSKGDKPLSLSRQQLLDKYNKLGLRKKMDLTPLFCSYLAVRQMQYKFDLG